MRRLLVVMVILATLASGSGAATPTLKGRFALSGGSGCINSTTMQAGVPVSPSGFTTALVANGNSFTNDQATEGVATFSTDGTGSVTGTTASSNLGDPNPAANADTFQYSFSYSIAADGTVTVQITAGSYSGTFTAGPRNGQTFAIANVPALSGHLGAGRKALTLAVKQPTVETITYSNGDAHDRVCHRAYSLVFMGR